MADELKSHREDGWLKISSVFAISQMAYDGATTEQLAGARMCMSTLLNLWESDTPEKRLPTQTLSTFDSTLIEVVENSKKPK